MSDARASLAATRVLDLRTPLSRIALAASALARESTRPAAWAQAQAIAEAVRDLDGRIDRILPLLVERPDAGGSRENVQDVLEEMHRRLAGGFEARGVAWRIAPATAPQRAAPATLRRAATALLRAGARCVGAGGSLELRGVRDGTRCGLRLAGGAAPGEALRADPEQVFPDALHELGARLSREPCDEPGRCLAVALWLPEDAT